MNDFDVSIEGIGSGIGGAVVSTKHYLGLGITLGWQDVSDTYQRSTLGPIWVTVGLAVQVTVVGLVFGIIFEKSLESYVPFIATSFVIWNFAVSTISDASEAYVRSSHLIKQVFVPFYLPIVRVLAKNAILFAHNLLIVLIAMLIFSDFPGLKIALFVLALVVVLGVLFSVSVIAALASARYRDLSPMISSGFTVSFYITPVVWMPEDLPDAIGEPLLALNPLFHLMELLRAPLLGALPSLTSWLVGVGILVFAGSISWLMSRNFGWRIVYWV